MKHVMTFEQHSVQEPITEGLFTSLKTDIDKFLKNPIDVKIADKLLKEAFAVQFNAKATAYLKDEVLALELEKKIDILTQASEKLSNKKVGILKIFKTKEGEWKVGGSGITGGATQAVKG